MAQGMIDMLLKTERVQKSIKRLRKYFKKNPKSPTPEKIHELRTSARRLESSLESMDIGKKKLKKRIERDLSVVRKRLGKVRDMDVLTAHAMSVSPKTPEQESLVELLEYLGAERSGHIKKLRKTARRYGPPLRNELRKIAKKVDDTANGQKQNGEPAVGFNKQQAGPLRELMAKLERPGHLTRRNLPVSPKGEGVAIRVAASGTERRGKACGGIGACEGRNRRVARLGRAAGHRNRGGRRRATVQTGRATEADRGTGIRKGTKLGQSDA
jgi:hypothetical protein